MSDVKDIGTGSSVKLVITPPLSDLIESHTKYEYQLSLWDRYLIWLYTTGSSSPNSYLTGTLEEPYARRWAFRLFSYYNYQHYGLDQIQPPFSKYRSFFIEPNRYLDLPEQEAYQFAQLLLCFFDVRLEEIILGAPRTTGEITVYKANSLYPGLPTVLPFEGHAIVEQKPFNSTTYDPQLNFAPFMSPNATCCMSVIRIPSGSSVLYISSTIHAYPNENEILLPFGCNFDVDNIYQDTLDYIPADKQKFITTQQGPPYVIGELFRLNQTSLSDVQTKTLTFYSITLIAPKILVSEALKQQQSKCPSRKTRHRKCKHHPSKVMH